MGLKNGVFHGRPAYWLAILVLLAGLLLSLLWAVTFGSVDLKMGDVYRVILYKVTEALHFPVGDSEVYGSGSMSDIVWFVRLPRLVLAIGVGMALALAGVVMQAIVKNPLADPWASPPAPPWAPPWRSWWGWAPSWAAAMWAWWPSPGRSWSPWG